MNLTNELHTSFNSLVTQLHRQISDGVDRANAGDERKPVILVNYDDAFMDSHRYCDGGLTEPDQGNIQRARWFQENWLFSGNEDLPFSGNAIAEYCLSAASAYLHATPTASLAPAYQSAFQISGPIDIEGSGQ